MCDYKRNHIPPIYNIRRLKETPIPNINFVEIEHVDFDIDPEEEIAPNLGPQPQNDPLQNEANGEDEENKHLFPPAYGQTEEQGNAEFLNLCLKSGIVV